ncbi:protein-L-isoaspartate O-methyltransferase family protein [Aeromicrobium ginsengisoli]|uniref:Protein-L-isoaspartate O-methyltransferase n=1 Tax=Aeromicrobium ginsengisoli TaxID=363867 RepID=A0A5M4FF78_9ACTN|nr:protein-L-isoaspartate O-methyltransferase [Aeromicrobium ginsengisoli]KAA1398005.1 protein-L-isoaspartate O-methyltransferase [Aeromicrobium ginsengisoli]
MDTAEVMRKVERARFLPRRQRGSAGLDQALEVGHGQTCSQPSTVADMLELLDVQPSMRVLDVGSGTGWTTALLGRLVGPGGEVIGCEIVPELVERGRENLAGEEMPWTRIEPAEQGALGRPEDGPFDRILVSAMSDSLPYELVEQLAPGGILVIPVAGSMTRVAIDAERTPEVTRHGLYRFVPLIR